MLVADFHLVQALHTTRELAADRDGSGWTELAGRTDRILDALGVDGEEAAYRPEVGIDRIDRTIEVDVDTADRAAASLMALHDRPDEDQLELANRAVRDLEDAVRTDQGRSTRARRGRS
jgi:hypothetical protein